MTNQNAALEGIMKIQNTSGQYWTGTCWGVEQNAVEYASTDDLPLWIDDGEGEELMLEGDSDDDVRYYRGDNEEAEASLVAS